MSLTAFIFVSKVGVVHEDLSTVGQPSHPSKMTSSQTPLFRGRLKNKRRNILHQIASWHMARKVPLSVINEEEWVGKQYLRRFTARVIEWSTWIFLLVWALFLVIASTTSYKRLLSLKIFHESPRIIRMQQSLFN